MAKIIYNVTCHVEDNIAQEWLAWMQQTHLPEVMQTGCFMDCRILRILQEEAQGGVSYAIQYTVQDMETFKRYEAEFAPILRAKTKARYGEQVLAFRTLLEWLEEGA